MKKIAAAIAMTASLFVATASNAEIIPQTIILPPTIGGWQGEWGILPWHPQFRNRNPEKQDTFAEQAGVAAL